MYVILLAAMVFISASLAGIFAPPFQAGKTTQNPQDTYTCCDNADCSPNTSKGFSYGGDPYALLKSDIYLDYSPTTDITATNDLHMDPTNVRDPNGDRIFLNITDRRGSEVFPECITSLQGGDNRGYDRLYGRPDSRNTNPGSAGKGCYAIPNEFLIYVCRTKDSPGNCFAAKQSGELLAGKLKFDVYVDTKKLQEKLNGVMPKVIKECYLPPTANTNNTPQQIAFRVSPGGQANLQLRTFSFVTEKGPVNWITPYCKPAIYLYPERKTEVNVSVFPQGKMLTTIPPYPKSGWDVVADPDGTIHYQNKSFDYLYYEASLPDQLITPPNEGFVMNHDERALFLTDLVTKLGLNEKETKQFVDYWVPILPQSPYYYVGIIPQATLTTIAPLIIFPEPKHTIRITLYFKPLEKKITVKPPIILPVSRDGFTAVEWGGIFKQDQNHPFSCFM